MSTFYMPFSLLLFVSFTLSGLGYGLASGSCLPEYAKRKSIFSYFVPYSTDPASQMIQLIRKVPIAQTSKQYKNLALQTHIEAKELGAFIQLADQCRYLCLPGKEPLWAEDIAKNYGEHKKQLLGHIEQLIKDLPDLNSWQEKTAVLKKYLDRLHRPVPKQQTNSLGPVFEELQWLLDFDAKWEFSEILTQNSLAIRERLLSWENNSLIQEAPSLTGQLHTLRSQYLSSQPLLQHLQSLARDSQKIRMEITQRKNEKLQELWSLLLHTPSLPGWEYWEGNQEHQEQIAKFLESKLLSDLDIHTSQTNLDEILENIEGPWSRGTTQGPLRVMTERELQRVSDQFQVLVMETQNPHMAKDGAFAQLVNLSTFAIQWMNHGLLDEKVGPLARVVKIEKKTLEEIKESKEEVENKLDLLLHLPLPLVAGVKEKIQSSLNSYQRVYRGLISLYRRQQGEMNIEGLERLVPLALENMKKKWPKILENSWCSYSMGVWAPVVDQEDLLHGNFTSLDQGHALLEAEIKTYLKEQKHIEKLENWRSELLMAFWSGIKPEERKSILMSRPNCLQNVLKQQDQVFDRLNWQGEDSQWSEKNIMPLLPVMAVKGHQELLAAFIQLCDLNVPHSAVDLIPYLSQEQQRKILSPELSGLLAKYGIHRLRSDLRPLLQEVSTKTESLPYDLWSEITDDFSKKNEKDSLTLDPFRS